MIQMLRRILNSYWFGVGAVEWIPDYVEPVAVSKLCRLVPLICSQSNRLTAPPALNFNAANPGDRVAVSRLRIGWANASHVKSNLQMSHTLTLEPSTRFV